jgi:hypothetical protein
MRLFALLLGLSTVTIYTLNGQPKLSLNSPEIDLGIIYSGVPKKGKIEYKNIGNDTLRITLNPTCGCTTIKPPKSFLLPNESDIAEVEFNSAGYRGKVEKYINITSNDPVSQYVGVKLIAEVKEELEPLNRSFLIWFGNLPIGKDSTQTTSFKNNSGHQLIIRGTKVSSSIVTVMIDKKRLNSNDTLIVRVSVKPGKIGYANEHFTIDTDSKNQPHVEMRVSFIGTQETK